MQIKLKSCAIISALISFLLAGCQYEAPFVKDHHVPIDPAVLGPWQPIQPEGEKSKFNEPMMILKYSNTEYLVHFPAGKGRMYFRGYPINIGDISCVQLKYIGNQDGPPGKGEEKLYHMASYRLKNGKLEIKILNTDLVDEELNTTEALVQSFLKHKDNKELFIYPEIFSRLRASN